MPKCENFLLNFLNQHTEFKSVLFFDSGISHDEMMLFRKETIQKINFNNECKNNTKYDIGIFKNVSANIIIDTVSSFKLSTVLVFVSSMDDYIAVWEILREKVSKIYSVFEENSNRNIVSEWEPSENNIELSVIFPVYNVANYIEKCIETTTAWKAPYVEFLFVDDGSTDNSAEIIKKYAEQDHRIKYYKKENGGCASARQFGLDRVSSRYVGFIDPDDFVDETMFKKLLSKALFADLDIVWCGFNDFYNSTGTFEKAVDLDLKLFEEPCFDKPTIISLIGFRRIAIWRGIYRMKMLKENGIGFNTSLRRFDDLPFKVQTFAVCNSCASINEHLYFYRLERPGQDVVANDERLYVHFDIFSFLDEFFLKFNNSLMNRFYQLVKFDTHLWGYTKIKDELKETYRLKAKEDLLKLVDKRSIEDILLEFYGKTRRKMAKRLIK